MLQDKKQRLQKILDSSFIDAAVTGGMVGGITGGALASTPFAVGALYHNPRDNNKVDNIFGYTVSTAVPAIAGAGVGGVAGMGIGTMALGVRKLLAWNALRKLQAQAASASSKAIVHKTKPTHKKKAASSVDPVFANQLLKGTALGAAIGGTSGVLINRILGRRALDARLALGGTTLGALIGLLSSRRNAWEAVRDRAHQYTKDTAYDKNIQYSVDSEGRHVVTNSAEIEKAREDGRIDPNLKVENGKVIIDGNPVPLVREWYIKDPEGTNPKLEYRLVPAKDEIRDVNPVREGIYVRTRPTPVLSNIIKGPVGEVIDGLPDINTASHHSDGYAISHRPEILSYKDRKGKIHHVLYKQNKDGTWGTNFSYTDLAKADDKGPNTEYNYWQDPYWNAVAKDHDHWRGTNPNLGLFKAHYNPPVWHNFLFNPTLENPHEQFVWVDEKGTVHTEKPNGKMYELSKDNLVPVKNLSMYGGGGAAELLRMLDPKYEENAEDKTTANRSHVFRISSVRGDKLRDAINAMMNNAVHGLAPNYQVAWLPGMPVYNCLTGVSDLLDRAVELGHMELDPNAPTMFSSSFSTRRLDGKHDPMYGSLRDDAPSAPAAMFPSYWDFKTNTFKE